MDVDLTRFELLRNAIDALKANAPITARINATGHTASAYSTL